MKVIAFVLVLIGLTQNVFAKTNALQWPLGLGTYGSARGKPLKPAVPLDPFAAEISEDFRTFTAAAVGPAPQPNICPAVAFLQHLTNQLIAAEDEDTVANLAAKIRAIVGNGIGVGGVSKKPATSAETRAMINAIQVAEQVRIQSPTLADLEENYRFSKNGDKKHQENVKKAAAAIYFLVRHEFPEEMYEQTENPFDVNFYATETPRIHRARLESRSRLPGSSLGVPAEFRLFDQWMVHKDDPTQLMGLNDVLVNLYTLRHWQPEWGDKQVFERVTFDRIQKANVPLPPLRLLVHLFSSNVINSRQVNFDRFLLAYHDALETCSFVTVAELFVSKGLDDGARKKLIEFLSAIKGMDDPFFYGLFDIILKPKLHVGYVGYFEAFAVPTKAFELFKEWFDVHLLKIKGLPTEEVSQHIEWLEKFSYSADQQLKKYIAQKIEELKKPGGDSLTAK